MLTELEDDPAYSSYFVHLYGMPLTQKLGKDRVYTAQIWYNPHDKRWHVIETFKLYSRSVI